MIEEQVDDGDYPIDVEMHGWAFARAPRQIGTTGLGPCIGLAIMDDKGAGAWVLHSPNMKHGGNELRGMLSKVQSECEQHDELRIVLTGGQDNDPEMSDDLMKDRILTICVVQEMLPNAQLCIIWGKVENFNLEHTGGVWRDSYSSGFF